MLFLAFIYVNSIGNKSIFWNLLSKRDIIEYEK